MAVTYCTRKDVAEFMMQQEISENTWPDDGLISRHIRLAASEISIALQTSDQLTCSKSDSGNDFLRLLNLIGAVLITEFDNVRQLTEGDLERYQSWKDENLRLIRVGELTLCDGETGMDYPAFATAEVGYTPEGQVQIIQNQLQRSVQ